MGTSLALKRVLQAVEQVAGTNAPVLVIRGTREEFMSRADSEAIAEHVNRVRPGQGRYLEIEGMTHGFTVDRKFHADLVPTVLSWMKNQLQGV